MAVDTAVRLYGPAAQATSATTRYTVAASTTVIVRSMLATNTASVPATITVSVGTDAAGTRVCDAVPLPAKSTTELLIRGFLVLAAAEIVQVTASATTVNLTMSGITTV